MLQAIAKNGSEIVLCINGREYTETDLPDGILTESELAEVRSIKPGALPGYAVFVDVPAEETTEETAHEPD